MPVHKIRSIVDFQFIGNTTVIHIVAEDAIWLQCPQNQPEYLPDLKKDILDDVCVLFLYDAQQMSRCGIVAMLASNPTTRVMTGLDK